MVEDEDARLRAIGIRVITDAEDPAVHAEAVRIARRIAQGGRRVIGLWPAGPDVAVPPIAVQLGIALTELTGGTVAFVDANIRWPAISAIALDEERGGGGTLFATRWLRGSLALLTPPTAGPAGAGVPQLGIVMEQGGALFGHILVDLTGFDRLGEHLEAMTLVEGVILVGRAGLTTEYQLLRLQYQLPAERTLGVLLVGSPERR